MLVAGSTGRPVSAVRSRERCAGRSCGSGNLFLFAGCNRALPTETLPTWQVSHKADRRGCSTSSYSFINVWMLLWGVCDVMVRARREIDHVAVPSWSLSGPDCPFRPWHYCDWLIWSLHIHMYIYTLILRYCLKYEARTFVFVCLRVLVVCLGRYLNKLLNAL